MLVFTPRTSARAYTALFAGYSKLVFKNSNTIEPVDNARIIDIASNPDLSAVLCEFFYAQQHLESKIIVCSCFEDRYLPWILDGLRNWPYCVQVYAIAPFYPALSTHDLRAILRSLSILKLYKLPCVIVQREHLEFVPKLPYDSQLSLLMSCYVYFSKIVNSPCAALAGLLESLRKTAFKLNVRKLYVICKFVRDCTKELYTTLLTFRQGGFSFVHTIIAQDDFWIMVASQDSAFADMEEFVISKVKSATVGGLLAEESWMQLASSMIYGM